jgi:YVTN family beta-propeller protein
MLMRFSRQMPNRFDRLYRFLILCVCIPGVKAPVLTAQSAATFGQVVKLGATPSDVVLDEQRQRLYLVNQISNRVDILSTTTNSLIDNIPVGQGPLAAAISMDGAFLYVTNGASSTVSVIDLNGGGVIQTVSMPATPQGVEAGADGRVLVSTLGTASGGTTSNTLIIFDPAQSAANQLTAVPTPPPPSTPTPLPPTTLTTPTTKFQSKLIRTPDGQYIVGLTIPSTTQTYLFVYEVSSGSILRSRTVTGQSTVLSMSPDGSRFMAGFTLYDVGTLSVLGQMNNANAPFSFPTTFSNTANIGGSVFSPEGTTLYGAFNVAANTTPAPPQNSSTLLLSDPGNLAIRLGIRLPENIVAKMVMTADGTDAWSLSQSGLIYLPLSTLFKHPILSVDSTQVFLTTNPCNPGLAQAAVRVSNIGAGKLTYAVTTVSSALTAQVSTGVAPSTVTFTMEPGRLTNVTRQAGTNLAVITGTGAVNLLGQALDVALASLEAINIPPILRVYMNNRNKDQRGVIFPIPTTPNNSPTATGITATAATLVDGDQGVEDIVLDQPRNRVYLTNAGYNRIEVFDTVNQRFLPPIPVNQLPHQMAMSTDGNTLYVASTGGELIDIVDLNLQEDVGHINFPPIPRQAGGLTAALLYPQALAAGLDGLEFVMSNGGQWKVVGGTAVPRPSDSITPSLLATPVNMLASPDYQNILTLTGSATAGISYVYNAASDAYVGNAILFTTPIQGYFGPLGLGNAQSFLTVGGLYTNASLTVLGGSANANSGTTGSQRHVAATAPFDGSSFVRFTIPVRATINTTPTSDARPTLELVNTSTGSPSLLAVAPENPRFTVFGATRFNLPSRSMVIDSNNVAYIITISGLSVVALTPTGAPAPRVAATNGVVNSSDGSSTLRVGGFININGSNLATASTALTLPAPTVLGGSCVTFNDVALPLLRSSSGQIGAQIPATVSAGSNVVQVRSLATGQQSQPVVVTVQRPAAASPADRIDQ